jgi:nuclear pore complex protein Nup155
VVSDPFRNCFYTLASKNIISMYRPTSDKTIDLIQIMSSLFASAQEKAPGDPAIAAKNFTILRLQVVHPDESRLGIQLVAITVNGVRMYFAPSTATSFFQGTGTGSSSDAYRPLQMIHVRLPPASLMHPADHVKVFVPPVQPTAEVRPIQPRTAVVSQLESFCYTEGLTVCSQQGDTEDDNDFLFGTAPDLTRIGAYGKTISQQQPNGQSQQQSQHLPWAAPSSYTAPVFRPPLTEHATLLDIHGHTLAIASFPRFVTNTVPPGCPAPVNINELATQFSEPVKHIMVLTDAGLSFIAKRRVLDYLRAVIEDVHALGNIQPIVDFKERYGHFSLAFSGRFQVYVHR